MASAAAAAAAEEERSRRRETEAALKALPALFVKLSEAQQQQTRCKLSCPMGGRRINYNL